MDRSYDRDREDRSRYRSGDWDRGEENRRRDWDDRSRDWGRRTENRVDNWTERAGDKMERAGDRIENWADRAGNEVRSWFDDDDDRRRGDSRSRGGYDSDRNSTAYNYGREGGDRGDYRGGTPRRDYDFGQRHLEDSGYSDRWHGRDHDNDWSREHPRSRQYGPTSQSSLYDNSSRGSSYGQSGSSYGTGSNYNSGQGSSYRSDRDSDRDWSRERRSSGGTGSWDRSDMSSDTNRGDRGFFERAGDEVRSWVGDEGAERRREMDERRDRSEGRRDSAGGSYSGWGSRGHRDDGW